MTKKLISSAAAAVALLLAPAAKADTGYVCNVRQYNFSGLGPDGGIVVQFSSKPGCAGDRTPALYQCSGGTFTSCAAMSLYWYREAQLQSIYTSLVAAARDGQKVFYGRGTCRGGGTGCLQAVDFWAN